MKSDITYLPPVNHNACDDKRLTEAERKHVQRHSDEYCRLFPALLPPGKRSLNWNALTRQDIANTIANLHPNWGVEI